MSINISEHETRWLTKTGAKMLREVGVKEGDTVIDFGCGEGRYTTPLSQITGLSGRVFAVECNEEAIEELQKRLDEFSKPKNVTLLKIDNLEESDLIKEKSVDLILAFDVLQYIENWEALFSFFFDVLKEGGIVVIYPAAIPHPGSVDIEKVRLTMEKTGLFFLEEKKFQLMHNVFMEDDIIFSFKKPNNPILSEDKIE